MGVVDLLVSLWGNIRLVVTSLLEQHHAFSKVLERIQTPAIPPSPNPTSSAWQEPPHPFPDVRLPDTIVDVLIIGSGITGASVAHELLSSENSKDWRVVMADSRGVCSGATGRNGGHIKYAPYEEYSRFLTRYGRARAAEIVRFRRAHLDELLGLAKHLGDSEAREVQTFDVYYDSEGFTKARSQLETYLADFPHERPNWLVHGGEETRSKLGFRRATGAFGFRAGALSPYNLVTTLLSELVKEHSKFSVHPNTQVAEIQPSLIPGQSIVSTADGRKLVAKHIVHATNGYASQVGLLPGMAGKIFPVRGTMSAHPTSSPPASDSFPHKGETSWSFVYQKGFDYCIQRPYPDGRLMLGGGLLNGEDDGLRDIGASTDDADTVSVLSDAHLRGLPGTVFGDAWGSPPSGRPVQVWTGVMGWSADMLPWVGEVGSDVVATGRRLGGAREWISAGYTGEGMINAWLCGRGLARMISEQDNHGVPQPFLFSRERRAKANVVDHVDDYFGR